MKNILLFPIVLLFVITASAQDPIGSQIGMQQGMYNPAAIGSGLTGSRLSAFFRNQWTLASLPYRSNGIMLEHRLGQLALGVNMLQQSSGPANFRQLNLGLGLSWNWKIQQTDFTLGWQVGLAQQSLNASNLQFDNQYVEGTGFDESLAHGEQLGNANIQVADIGVGMQVTHHFDQDRPIEQIRLGFGLGHASQPEFSFLNTNSHLPRRYTFFGEVSSRPISGIQWIGRYLMAQQGNAMQHHAQLHLRHQLDPDFVVSAGLGYRIADAIVPMVQIDIDRWQVGLSYDITMSGLRNTNQSKGGIELQANWRFGKKKTEEIPPLDIEEEQTISISKTDTLIHFYLPKKDSSICKCEDQLKTQSPSLPAGPTVYFDTDKSLIKNQYHEALDELAVLLITNPEVSAQISGHTDMEGSSTYNFHLGMARAESVKEFLMSRGVKASQCTLFSFGESKPAAVNHNPTGRSLNRRTDILLYH